MSRTIRDIYNEAVSERNKRLELNEFSNNSKLSILNGITWTVAVVIYSFETLLDVFAVDISTTINQRVNGTPTYYANALLQYQKGDELLVREDGLAFGYASVDESKRIITQVSYIESTDDANLDSKLILKVATGTKGNLSAITAEDLVPINTYIGKIKFAGTRVEVISSKGDVLSPRISVYYDGAVTESEMYDRIEAELKKYVMNIDFDAAIYVSKVVAAIRQAEQVFGRYAVLLESPFAKQTIRKDLVVTGTLKGQKEISSKTALSVASENGYTLKQLVYADGNSSTGVYLNGLLVNEIVLCTDGSIRFRKSGKELARMNDEGLVTRIYNGEQAYLGSLVIAETGVFNRTDATDEGVGKINYLGYQGGHTKYRNFEVYDGKQASITLFEVVGKSWLTRVNGLFTVKNTGQGIHLMNTAYSKGDVTLVNLVSWYASPFLRSFVFLMKKRIEK